VDFYLSTIVFFPYITGRNMLISRLVWMVGDM